MIIRERRLTFATAAVVAMLDDVEFGLGCGTI